MEGLPSLPIFGAERELGVEAIMLFEKAISDVCPGLLNVERSAHGNINAPDERLQRLSVGRELSQLTNQLDDGNPPLRSALFKKGGDIVRKVHNRGHTASIPAPILSR